MSKKKLLEESTVRSFMKLANLQPLSDKFIKESWSKEEELEEGEEKAEEELEEAKHEGAEEDELEEVKKKDVEEDELQESSHVVFGHDEDAKSRDVPQDRQNPTSGGGGSHKKAPQKAKVEKPGKMDAAKNAPGDAKLKPMKQTHVHSDKSDSIEHTKKSNAPKKNNSTFEVVAESVEQELEEAEMDSEMPEAPEADMGAEAGSEGESPEHKEKMKGIIHSMLDLLQDMAAQYDIDMQVSKGDEEPEAPETPALSAPPDSEDDQEEQDEMKMEQLDEMVEKLTKRVADRLVKESKKKR